MAHFPGSAPGFPRLVKGDSPRVLGCHLRADLWTRVGDAETARTYLALGGSSAQEGIPKKHAMLCTPTQDAHGAHCLLPRGHDDCHWRARACSDSLMSSFSPSDRSPRSPDCPQPSPWPPASHESPDATLMSTRQRLRDQEETDTRDKMAGLQEKLLFFILMQHSFP